MEHEKATLTTALTRCLAPPEQAFCLPPAAYTTPEVQTLEADRIFSRGWIPLGRADRVKSPGDFEALEIAGRPLILLRDTQGQLRAHANTCRHRGARLVEGCGNVKGIRCPFHAWLYKLDGTLAAAPRMEAAKDFDRADYGLVSYHAQERHGFAFVSFEAHPPALDRWLGDFAEIHAAWPLETLVTTRRWTREFACDWKAFIDVFNEYYHLPYVHRATLDGLYADPDPAEAVTGQYATQFGATEGTGGLLDGQQQHALPPMPGLTGRNAAGVRYSWLFPSLTFAAGNDAMWVYEAYPVTTGRCRVTQSACFPPETVALPGFEAKAAAYYHRLDTALDEDIPALENQQRGLASPDARQGRFSPGLEPNVAAFARWYAGRMLNGA
jgi:phenylpropionate dioxygenase-like ring-hydroxylating dioxygenase large terminal subunit